MVDCLTGHHASAPTAQITVRVSATKENVTPTMNRSIEIKSVTNLINTLPLKTLSKFDLNTF